MDIIIDGVVDIKGDESQAEKQFVDILKGHQRYGKNEKTLNRYLGYHEEIQGLMKR